MNVLQEFHGFYGVYRDVNPAKITAYIKFLKTEAGKQWKDDVQTERRNWNRNSLDNRRRR